MAEEMVIIQKWKFKTIENALRLTHRINKCSTKETAFDREVVKAYDYAKSALAEPSSAPQANELLPLVSNNEVAVCVHPFKFVVIHGSRCHCFKCGHDIDTQTDC